MESIYKVPQDCFRSREFESVLRDNEYDTKVFTIAVDSQNIETERSVTTEVLGSCPIFDNIILDQKLQVSKNSPPLLKRMKKPITMKKSLFGQIRIKNPQFDKIIIVKKQNDSNKECLKKRNMTHVTYPQERSLPRLNKQL